MPTSAMDHRNLDACNDWSYVEAMESYANARGLTPAEQLLFERYVPRGSDVLDMGVGTGRTIPALVERARRYVGIDYAPLMIERGRQLFPDVDLRVMSAADLSPFADASFDVVLFIANGLDSMSDEAHAACLTECHRVLRPGGALLISRHNARGIAPTVDPSMVPDDDRPVRSDVWEGAVNAWRNRRFLLTRAFWTGAGKIDDPPFVFEVVSRRRAIADLRRHGFRHAQTLSGMHPRRSVSLTTAWYFYAFHKA